MVIIQKLIFILILCRNIDKYSLNLLSLQTFLVSRMKGKNVVIMDLEEYNSLQETIHLTSTHANRNRLRIALVEMESGKHSKLATTGQENFVADK